MHGVSSANGHRHTASLAVLSGSISMNNIGAVGAEALGEALETNSSLQTLGCVATCLLRSPTN